MLSGLSIVTFNIFSNGKSIRRKKEIFLVEIDFHRRDSFTKKINKQDVCDRSLISCNRSFTVQSGTMTGSTELEETTATTMETNDEQEYVFNSSSNFSIDCISSAPLYDVINKRLGESSPGLIG